MERDKNSFEPQKDADESKSKDIHYNGQASGDVWFCCGLKGKGKKESYIQQR